MPPQGTFRPSTSLPDQQDTTIKPSTTMLNIAIAGAGPVGCTLARLILTSPISHQINLTIFEKDSSRHSRTSLGGTLDLHPETGLAAMEAMNLMPSFKEHARYEGEEMRMCDLNGFVYFHMTEAPNIEGYDARPEIDRVKLMDVLLQGVLDVAPDVVQWGKPVKGLSMTASRTWMVAFADDTEQGPFDLVVGADGAWSKVRDVLTNVRPAYSGISTIAGQIDEKSAGQHWEKIQGMVGKGNNFSYSYGQTAMLQRMGDGSLKSSFSAKRELGWIFEMKEMGEEEIRRVLREKYAAWHPDFHLWIQASRKLWCAPLWELPVGHRWEHRRGVTCIGDSAHLMTPYAGEGVNAGMRDALDLFGKLKDGIENSDLDSAVKEFEESMFNRAGKFMRDTEVNKNGMHASDAPYGFFADMAGVAIREVSGYDVSKGWKWCLWLPVKSLAYGVFWFMGTYGALRRRLSRA